MKPSKHKPEIVYYRGNFVVFFTCEQIASIFGRDLKLSIKPHNPLCKNKQLYLDYYQKSDYLQPNYVKLNN